MCERQPAQRRFLTTKEAAAYLEHEESFVRRLRQDGAIRAYKIGALVRYSLADLDAYLDSCLDPPIDEIPRYWGRGGTP